MNLEYPEAYSFLTTHPVAILSTSTHDSRPWGAAVYYAIDESFNFFFMTHVESRKCQNLSENPYAAITVASNDEQTTAQVSGLAVKLLGDDNEANEAFRKLAAIRPPGAQTWSPPVSKMDTGKIMVFKLKPDTLQFSQFNTNHTPPSADITKII